MLLRFRQRLLFDHSAAVAVTTSVAVDVVDFQTNRRCVVVFVVLPLTDVNEVLGKSGSQLEVRVSRTVEV